MGRPIRVPHAACDTSHPADIAAGMSYKACCVCASKHTIHAFREQKVSGHGVILRLGRLDFGHQHGFEGVVASLLLLLRLMPVQRSNDTLS
jgi:hypothetical protein